MSNESRTMLVVLLVCGLLMFGCIVLPVGLGAAFFFMASQRAEVVAAEQAIAAEQVARAQAAQAQAAQAQADAQAAQQALQQAMPRPRVPPLPQGADLPAIPPAAPATSPPTIPLPPIGGSSDADLFRNVQAEVVATVLADVEKRKELYTTLKTLDAGLKQQMMDIFKAAGITQEHIDKIMAEGEKEGW